MEPFQGIDLVLLETRDGLEREEQLILKIAKANVEIFQGPGNLIRKRIRENKDKDLFVSGSLQLLHWSIGQLSGKQVPLVDDYPACLRDHLHRQVWRTTLKRLTHQLSFGNFRQPVFIKPYKVKRFQPRLVTSLADLDCLETLGKSTQIWCSEKVSIISEWRAYIVRGQVLKISHYDGDALRLPNLEIIHSSAWKHFAATELSACALDWAVLRNGKTALIEVNDAFSIGAYDVEPELYAHFLLTRWKQLVN